MLNAIKAVMRCTAPNDAVPILAHVAIVDGHMHAFNGRIYAHSPIKDNPLDLDGICLRADMLHAALSALGTTKARAEVDMEHGSLQLTSKKYRARVPVRPIEDFFIQPIPAKPKGTKLDADLDLPGTLNELRGIVGDMPALPWTHGFLIERDYIAATNSSTMARVKAACGIAPTIITLEFAAELIAQGAQVTRLLSAGGRITAWLDNSVVLSSVIIDGAWPKSFESVVDPLHKGAKFTPVPEGIAAALQSILPFSADAKTANITMLGDKMELVSSDTASASATVDGLVANKQCAFNAAQLTAVLALCDEWDLSKFPMVPFRSKERGITGGFAGVRV